LGALLRENVGALNTEITDVCVCCRRPFRAHDRAICTSCGAGFHLAMRIDVVVEECGEVWINDELEALEFGCNRCLDKAGRMEQSSPKEGRGAV